MSQRKLIGKSKLSNVHDKSGVYTLEDINFYELENKSILLGGYRHQRQDVYSENIGNVDPYYNHVVYHIPGPQYDTHILKDQSGNNFDEFLGAHHVNIETPLIEAGPKEYHSTYFNEQSYQVTDTATLRLSADFTIEFWMKTGRAYSAETYIMGKGTGVGKATSAGSGWVIYLTTGNLIGFFDGVGNTSTVSGTAITHDTWTHIAIVRSGTGVTIYQDGVSVGTGTSTTAFADQNAMYIGKDRSNSSTTYFGGYLFDLRIKSSAVYTSTPFTRPTTLLDMSGSVLSISGTEFSHPYNPAQQREGLTIINQGDSYLVKKVADHPFITKYPRPTGSGNSCAVAVLNRGFQYTDSHPTKSLSFGTNPFTIECWVYPSTDSRTSNLGIAGKGTLNEEAVGATGWSLVVSGSGYLQWANGASTLASAQSSRRLNPASWNHIAVVREGTGAGQFKMYINGNTVFANTQSANFNQTASPLIICAGRNHNYSSRNSRFFGFRLSDVARYTADFTIDSNTFFSNVATASANTILYTLDTKDKKVRPRGPQYIIDGYEGMSLAAHARGAYGSNRPSTRSLFSGSYSISCVRTSASTDALYAVSTASGFSFGTGDLSIEFWACHNYEQEYAVGQGTPIYLFDCRANFNDTAGFAMRYEQRSLQIITAGRVILSDSSSILPNRAWTHICLQRTSGNLALYVNGVKRVETLYSGSMNASSNKFYFMNAAYAVRTDSRFLGWFSDIRVLNGSGAYSVGSSNPDRIRVPTQPLTSISNTVLLTGCGPFLKDYSGLSTTAVWAGNRADANYTSSWDIFVSGFGPYTGIGAGVDKSNSMITDMWDGTNAGAFAESASNDTTSRCNELTWIHRMAKPWTIEGWFYAPTTNATTPTVNPTWIYTSATVNTDGWALIGNYAGTANSFGDVTFLWRSTRLGVGINEYINSSGSTGNIFPNGWNHIAVVYDPTKTNKHGLFINGSRVATKAAAFTTMYSYGSRDQLQNGGYSGTGDTRISDIARYDIDQTTYTVPTTAFVRDANTAVLLRFDTMFKDYAGIGNHLMSGLIKPSYQYTKWGGGSISFGNPSTTGPNYDYIDLPGNNGYAPERVLDTRFGDFTVEGWAQWKDATAGGRATQTTAPGACLVHYQNTYWVGINTSGYWALLARSSGTTSFTPTLLTSVAVATSTAGTWNHWAFVRKDGDYFLYVDGVLITHKLGANHGTYASNGPVAAASSSDNFSDISDFRIGYEYPTSIASNWCGHLEDLRVTALARYSPGSVNGVLTMCLNGTNTPGLPTQAFPRN